MMPPVVKKPVYGRDKFRCPRCHTVHHWNPKKCMNPKCKYVGSLERVTK